MAEPSDACEMTYPAGIIGVAKRRTAFLINRMANWDMPLKAALASAYLQGMTDAIDCVNAIEERKKLPS